MRHVIPLVVDGRIRVKELITHRFPLVDFAEAFDAFMQRTGGALKIIIEP